MPGIRPVIHLIKDESGASIVYVTAILALLIGFFGMALDFGRIYMTDSQAKAHADAIAMAAATQLDGQAGAIARATSAAGATLNIINNETYADNGVGAAPIAISSIRFLSSLPADDDTAITAANVTNNDADARFVEVTTEDLDHTNIFLVAVGVPDTGNTRATAVAGFTQTICLPTPLMMCNPNEAPPPNGQGTGAGFDINNWRGHQVAARTQGPGAQLAPGTFGFLDSLAGNSASALGEMLASTAGLPTCTDTGVDVRPGNPNSVRNALNVRFDIYENPGFKNGYREARYRPAANVTKGRIWTGPGANKCNSFNDASPNAAALGRDTNISSSQRIGNGQWDCAAYWDIHHQPLGRPRPPGCTPPAANMISRYDIYRYEIDNNIIPNRPGGENGNPICHQDSGSIVDDPDNDRRVLYLAVVNCVQQNLRGNRDNVPTIAVLKTFITEKAGDENTPGNNDFDIYLEIVDEVITGQSNGVLHDIVQLYR